MICPTCDGYGIVASYLADMTLAERQATVATLDWEQYVAAYQRGEFDRPCPDCAGTGTITNERNNP